MPGKRNKRRVFLERLGKALVAPFIERRKHLSRGRESCPCGRSAQPGPAVAMVTMTETAMPLLSPRARTPRPPPPPGLVPRRARGRGVGSTR
ncbi:hypothetical protein KUCAC02_030566 [Chaenocephalus aceratus]|uniref:Uncharacterized protein n=1 Tax=Chaenocephalus aceratus TaxID=36190 RepID=A0ACB9XKA2_CHAAC|nr:hypothetical protein KUCAC02_030566 [Chaenocephalus aceratus]